MGSNSSNDVTEAINQGSATGTRQADISPMAYGQALDIVTIMGGRENIIPLGHVDGRVVVMMRDSRKLDDGARDFPLMGGSLLIDVGNTEPGEVVAALREICEEGYASDGSEALTRYVEEAARLRREHMAAAAGRLDDGTPYFTQRMLDNGISRESLGKPLYDEPFETRAWRTQARELQQANERLRRELADARAQVDALRQAERLRALEEERRESCEGILPERAEEVLSELEGRVSAMLDNIRAAQVMTGELGEDDLEVTDAFVPETLC